MPVRLTQRANTYRGSSHGDCLRLRVRLVSQGLIRLQQDATFIQTNSTDSKGSGREAQESAIDFAFCPQQFKLSSAPMPTEM